MSFWTIGDKVFGFLLIFFAQVSKDLCLHVLGKSSRKITLFEEGSFFKIFDSGAKKCLPSVEIVLKKFVRSATYMSIETLWDELLFFVGKSDFFMIFGHRAEDFCHLSKLIGTVVKTALYVAIENLRGKRNSKLKS